MYVWLVLMSVGLGEVSANRAGAPSQACTSMIPDHPGNTASSGGDRLYSLSIENPGHSILRYTVILTARGPALDFLGFFIQARNSTSGELAEGEFDMSFAPDFQARPCPDASSPNNGITHKGHNRLPSVIARWSPTPGSSTTNVFFKASVVDTFGTYYVGLEAHI